MAPRRLNRVEAALAAAAGDLDALGRRWALVGGLAVSARAEPRTTRDVDIAVDVEDDRDDIRNLLREATDADVACARNAVRLVAQRGFARGRDLERLLDAALAEPSMTK